MTHSESRWPRRRLDECGEFLSGGTPDRKKSSYWNGSIPWISAKSLRTFYLSDSAERVTDEGARNGTRVVPSGTILFVVRGMSLANEFRVGVSKRPVAFNQDVRALVPAGGIDAVYLTHFLRSAQQTVLGLVDHASHGTARVTSDRLDALTVPVPPLVEQRRIADVLDRAESLRVRRRTALALVDSLTRSIFLELFGDPRANPKGWPTVNLGEIISVGPQNGLYKPSTEYGAGTPIVRIDAFYDGVITKLRSLKRVRVSEAELETYGLMCGDILINRVNSREYLGKSALVPPLIEPIVFESNMMRLRVDASRVEAGFVVQFLQTEAIRQQIARAAKDAVNQSSINQTDVKGFQINLPPLSLQRQFVDRAREVEKLQFSQNASLAELDTLFASLQHRAFRGEI